MFSMIKNLLFGKTNIVTSISNVVDKWHPSITTKNHMMIARSNQSIKMLQAGEASQNSARSMIMPQGSGLFNNIVDGVNRLIRPVISFWVIGILTGIISPPLLQNLNPIILNIVWTVITFWFGSRMLFKDLPNGIKVIKGILK